MLLSIRMVSILEIRGRLVGIAILCEMKKRKERKKNKTGTNKIEYGSASVTASIIGVRASEAFHLVLSPPFPHPILSFPLKLSRFLLLKDWIPEKHNLSYQQLLRR